MRRQIKKRAIKTIAPSCNIKNTLNAAKIYVIKFIPHQQSDTEIGMENIWLQVMTESYQVRLV